MKIKLLIITVLLCFTSNNLLFGYLNSKTNIISLTESLCSNEDMNCCDNNQENECCSTDGCCGNINTGNHFSFSIITSNIGEKNFICFERNFISKFILHNNQGNLCTGYLQSLIKPPLI